MLACLTRASRFLTFALSGTIASAGLSGSLTIEAEITTPAPLRGRTLEVLCGLRQSGRILAEWSWTADATRDSGPHTFTTTLNDSALSHADPNGPAELILCLNQDELRSFHPSFGDFFYKRAVDLRGGRLKLQVGADWKPRTLSQPENLLTVHYHRFDGDYEAVGLWTWAEPPCHTPANQEAFAVGKDSFGVVFQIDLADYPCERGRVGLLPRLGGNWERKDGTDRFWEASLGHNIYMCFADAKIHPTMPDVNPKIASATMTSEIEVEVRFTHRLPVEAMAAARFTLFNEDGRELEIVNVMPRMTNDGKAQAFLLRVADPLDIAGHAYRLHVRDLGDAAVTVGALLSDPARFADDSAVIGAICTPEQTAFGLFAPTARQAHVVLADAPVGSAGSVEHAMKHGAKGVWRLELVGDYAGKFYSFRVVGTGGASQELADPAAVCGSGLAARPMLVNPRSARPPGFDPSRHPPLASPTDAVIYEMSVRDLTMGANSGVRHKGLYLGITESGTHLEGDPSIKTGLDHLVELGVTHVQLMPIQDFDNDESDRKTYNWGYMPVLFSTPDGWFATNPVGPSRILELKLAIQALHERGIGVTLDVVYNHTAEVSPLDKLVPGYYYRLTDDGRLSNGSGCGNEFNSENPMARRLMLDSLLTWVREFGIDGFRFDLMGLHAPQTMIAVRDALRAAHPEVLIYGEPWTGGATTLPEIFDKAHARRSGIAAFNDTFRDAIKGDRDGGASGFIQVGDQIEGVKRGICGGIDDWTANPTDAIQYCEAHDNLTTWDKLIQSAGNAPEAVRARMQRFAGLIVLTSQGIPFLHSGQELCRSKRGNHNSYNAPDETNQIDWSLKRQHSDVFTYFQGLISIRKSHPVFRLRTAAEVRRRLAFAEAVPHPKCLAYTLDGEGIAGESWSSVLVLMNGDSDGQTFVLPPGRWLVYADADRAQAQPIGETAERVTLPPHAGMVLAQ